MNFPTNPSHNDTFEYNGRLYVFNNGSWCASTTDSDTKLPTKGSQGDFLNGQWNFSSDELIYQLINPHRTNKKKVLFFQPDLTGLASNAFAFNEFILGVYGGGISVVRAGTSLAQPINIGHASDVLSKNQRSYPYNFPFILSHRFSTESAVGVRAYLLVPIYISGTDAPNKFKARFISFGNTYQRSGTQNSQSFYGLSSNTSTSSSSVTSGVSVPSIGMFSSRNSTTAVCRIMTWTSSLVNLGETFIPASQAGSSYSNIINFQIERKDGEAGYYLTAQNLGNRHYLKNDVFYSATFTNPMHLEAYMVKTDTASYGNSGNGGCFAFEYEWY